MKVFVRDSLNLEKPVNLRRLSSPMKLYVGIVMKWRESKMYKVKINKQLQAEYLEQVKRDDKLKEVLLAQIYNELNNNHTLGEKGEVCDSIVLSVKSKYFASLERVLSHKDFLMYDIRRVEENSDIRVAFKNMPILLEVRKKLL